MQIELGHDLALTLARHYLRPFNPNICALGRKFWQIRGNEAFFWNPGFETSIYTSLIFYKLTISDPGSKTHGPPFWKKMQFFFLPNHVVDFFLTCLLT